MFEPFLAELWNLDESDKCVVFVLRTSTLLRLKGRQRFNLNNTFAVLDSAKGSLPVRLQLELELMTVFAEVHEASFDSSGDDQMVTGVLASQAKAALPLLDSATLKFQKIFTNKTSAFGKQLLDKSQKASMNAVTVEGGLAQNNQQCVAYFDMDNRGFRIQMPCNMPTPDAIFSKGVAAMLRSTLIELQKTQDLSVSDLFDKAAEFEAKLTKADIQSPGSDGPLPDADMAECRKAISTARDKAIQMVTLPLGNWIACLKGNATAAECPWSLSEVRDLLAHCHGEPVSTAAVAMFQLASKADVNGTDLQVSAKAAGQLAIAIKELDNRLVDSQGGGNVELQGFLMAVNSGKDALEAVKIQANEVLMHLSMAIRNAMVSAEPADVLTANRALMQKLYTETPGLNLLNGDVANGMLGLHIVGMLPSLPAAKGNKGGDLGKLKLSLAFLAQSSSVDFSSLVKCGYATAETVDAAQAVREEVDTSMKSLASEWSTINASLAVLQTKYIDILEAVSQWRLDNVKAMLDDTSTDGKEVWADMQSMGVLCNRVRSVQ